ncbi:MAG: alpha-E domain-containing protein [Polyangiaceae bacterium]|nr:alpha-E domain-containing protein [Polyangiaceae bacterium]
MLSRVADALYWMSRYVERAEHAARVLEVTRRMLIDVEPLAPQMAKRIRDDAFRSLGLPGVDLHGAIFDESEPGSIASSVFRARENARQVQEVISSEMWGYINETHWMLSEARRAGPSRELPDLLGEVVKAGFLWAGVTDATMGRGPGWLFIRLGQFVERADRTSRIFAAQWEAIEELSTEAIHTSGDHFAWLTLLRSCGSLEEYRKRYPTRMTARQVADFMLLDDTFPRTVRYSVSVAAEFSKRLTQFASPERARAERAFGRVASRIEYTTIDEVMETGPAVFVRGVAEEILLATAELQSAYFLH